MRFLFDHDVPDDLSYVVRQLGHAVTLLREVLPRTATDSEVLAYAAAHDLILVTCNRNDFLDRVRIEPHRGLIVLIRRKSRTAERVALVHLLEKAGDQGLANNINFA